MSLFAKRSKKTIWTALLLIMALLLSAVPMFAPASALEPPTSSTPLPTPSGVTSITIGGKAVVYEQDNNVSDKFIRAVLWPGSTEYDLKHATVVVNLVSAGTAVSSGTPGMTFSGSGTTTRTATDVDLVNKAYNVTIGSDSYILAAGLPDGPVGIAPLDPLGVYVDFNPSRAVTTNPVSGIAPDSAIISGRAAITEGSISEIGYVYGTSPDATTASGKKVVTGQGNGYFSKRQTGLESGTTYYVKAYAVTSKGTVYGNEVSFTTSPWYYTEVSDGSGGIYKIYLSDIGAVADENNKNVKALVARYNESLGINEIMGRVYALTGSNWIDSGAVATLPGGGGTGTARAGLEESKTSRISLPSIEFIDFEGLKIDLRNKFLEKIGVDIFDLYEEEIQMITDGVATGIDDNFFFGLIQKFSRADTHYDDAYFLTGKIVVDAGAVVYFAGRAGTANAAADAAFARAAATAAAGGLTALTGVGAPVAVVEEGGAIVHVIAGVGGKIVAAAASAASGRSASILYADNGKLGSLPGSGGTPSSPQFKSQSLLDGHYEKHVQRKGEFGNISKSEYLRKARELLTSTSNGDILIKIRASNGDKIYYKQSSNEFGTVTVDGTIRTYFKPNPSDHGYPTNLDYFNAQ
ncbi:hypothetical protein AT727_13400 [Desulfitobacterium hafniense]|uniref:Fibronectin type-III domain-containing protein n=1 Tax=Desulfitobacterium hafniense TaxID=49338 RepID=A0A0W1JCN2_DESHA|nr:fibronectin type III domain-containing protein [Desulfitobacterium hafniense]KTE89388.1 hypothetical protein AT727_13400 [Desulfitobacterium hafniense]